MTGALLLAAACLGLTGCATIKSWFGPSDPPARAEQPDESLRRQLRPQAPSAPRSAPLTPVTPRPPASVPAAPPPAPDAPPPVLSPVLSTADEQRLRAETQQKIDGAEQLVRQIDSTKLAPAQQDSFRTVQSFLEKAREAAQAQDIQRAYTLADKAYLLVDELSRRPR